MGLRVNCILHLFETSMSKPASIFFRKMHGLQNMRHISRLLYTKSPATVLKNYFSYIGVTSSWQFNSRFLKVLYTQGNSEFSSASEASGIQNSVLPLQTKKRVPRKKTTIAEQDPDRDKFLTVAYSSAEEYNLQVIISEIEKQGLYEKLLLPDDAEDVLHVTAKYQVGTEPRHIFFFSEGSVVFWNVPETEQKAVLDFLKPFSTCPYEENLVIEEKEDLEYIYSENSTRFHKGRIILGSHENTDLETYAFSDAMSHSVRLALWEASLESFIESIEWVTENMKAGHKVKMSRDQVFRKRGELFALRHVINLSSDLLDMPDFYWDRQDLEILYQQTCNHLNTARRIKVMNERLSYCSELIDLLSNHMNDKHHVRLELMIIALIMVEVMFECVHFLGSWLQN